MSPSTQPASGADPVDPSRTQLIETARKNWIDRLIDLSRRNNLLFYRPVLSGTLDIPEGIPALTNLLAGEAVQAQALMANALDRPSRILNIALKAMENKEEKGLQTLYLGLGFASWTAKDGGREINAPIFLIPVSFKQKGRDASFVEVEIAGDVQVNPVLVHVLSAEFRITVKDEELLPGENTENNDELMSPYLAAFKKLTEYAKSVPGFSTRSSAVIGNFAFAKLAMVNDLKESASVLSKNDMIAAIAGDNVARGKLGSSQASVDPRT